MLGTPPSPGNTRIGAPLSLLYMRQEGIANDLIPEALTAPKLLITQSTPSDTDLMVPLVFYLLAQPPS
ncbi:MAG: hypothetical protein OXR82_19685 [Gammaproteobacteria bacterium]|nr:hypothetical protein [Gammaproteobacteria bacterium]